MGKAEIEGLSIPTTPKETEKETEKFTFDEILENTRQAYMVDLALSQESARMALGEFSDEYIYNLPRSSPSGKEDWGSLCDKMPNGYCYYRDKKIKHVHILGVNINGAIAIMNAYMGLSISASDPVFKEDTLLINGKLITKAYWTTTVNISNKKTDTELDLPFSQDIMQKAGDGYQYNEYGKQICISKGIRNAILKVVPEDFQKRWIEEYKNNGKQASKPNPQGNKKDKPSDKPEDKPTQPTNDELTPDSAIAHFKEIDNISHLSNWYNKNSAWLNSLKPEEKSKVINAFNAKNAELVNSSDIANGGDQSNAGKDNGGNEVKPATVGQNEAIKSLAKTKGYDEESLKAMMLTIVSKDDVGDMTFDEAALVISNLQK